MDMKVTLEDLQLVSSTSVQRAKASIGLLQYTEGLVRRNVELTRLQMEIKLRKLESRARTELREMVEKEKGHIEHVIDQMIDVMSRCDALGPDPPDCDLLAFKYVLDTLSEQIECRRVIFECNKQLSDLIDESGPLGEVIMQTVNDDTNESNSTEDKNDLSDNEVVEYSCKHDDFLAVNGMNKISKSVTEVPNEWLDVDPLSVLRAMCKSSMPNSSKYYGNIKSIMKHKKQNPEKHGDNKHVQFEFDKIGEEREMDNETNNSNDEFDSCSHVSRRKSRSNSGSGFETVDDLCEAYGHWDRVARANELWFGSCGKENKDLKNRRRTRSESPQRNRRRKTVASTSGNRNEMDFKRSSRRKEMKSEDSIQQINSNNQNNISKAQGQSSNKLIQPKKKSVDNDVTKEGGRQVVNNKLGNTRETRDIVTDTNHEDQTKADSSTVDVDNYCTQSANVPESSTKQESRRFDNDNKLDGNHYTGGSDLRLGIFETITDNVNTGTRLKRKRHWSSSDSAEMDNNSVLLVSIPESGSGKSDYRHHTNKSNGTKSELSNSKICSANTKESSLGDVSQTSNSVFTLPHSSLGQKKSHEQHTACATKSNTDISKKQEAIEHETVNAEQVRIADRNSSKTASANVYVETQTRYLDSDKNVSIGYNAAEAGLVTSSDMSEKKEAVEHDISAIMSQFNKDDKDGKGRGRSRARHSKAKLPSFNEMLFDS